MRKGRKRINVMSGINFFIRMDYWNTKITIKWEKSFEVVEWWGQGDKATWGQGD
jgi:hypothetical protein